MKDNPCQASVGFRLLELVCSSGVESFQPCHHGRICSILTKSGSKAETTQQSSRKPRFAMRLAMDTCITTRWSYPVQKVAAHLHVHAMQICELQCPWAPRLICIRSVKFIEIPLPVVALELLWSLGKFLGGWFMTSKYIHAVSQAS